MFDGSVQCVLCVQNRSNSLKHTCKRTHCFSEMIKNISIVFTKYIRYPCLILNIFLTIYVELRNLSSTCILIL